MLVVEVLVKEFELSCCVYLCCQEVLFWLKEYRCYFIYISLSSLQLNFIFINSGSRFCFFFTVVSCFVSDTYSQYHTMGSSRKLSKSACDTSAKSTLVEHFFNIIFTEFHSTPPVCVCVQMCPDQPTYCYPNGCLKRADINRKTEIPLPVNKISESTKPIFFVEEKNDFMNDFLTKNYIDDNIPIAAPSKLILLFPMHELHSGIFYVSILEVYSILYKLQIIFHILIKL